MEFTGLIFSADFAQVASYMAFVSLGPDGLDRRRAPELRGKTGFAMKSLQQKSHYWDH